jgi:hypothetical protein
MTSRAAEKNKEASLAFLLVLAQPSNFRCCQKLLGELKTNLEEISFPENRFSHTLLCGVARFFMVQHTKTGKIYQMTTTYTECQFNIPNGSKM